MMGNKYQGLGYARQEPKIKPTIAQAASIVKKVIKVLKPKVSVLTPPKGTVGRYGYTSNIYFYNTRDKFVPTCHHCGRIWHIKPHCIDIENPSVPNSNYKGKLIKIWTKKSRLRCIIVLSVLNASKTDLWHI